MLQKRMFKVISPVERKDGNKFWMRVGSGFTNKDDSINIYLDAIPAARNGEITLQVRELTEEDLRPRGEKRASHASSHAANPSAQGASTTMDQLPF